MKAAKNQLLLSKIDKNTTLKSHIFSFAYYFHYDDGTPIPLCLDESSISLESSCERIFQVDPWRFEIRFFEK